MSTSSAPRLPNDRAFELRPLTGYPDCAASIYRQRAERSARREHADERTAVVFQLLGVLPTRHS